MPAPGRKKRFTVGLTGGVGSGKTTVSTLFHALGTDIIDADAISRNLVSPGSPLLEKILAHFGTAIADPSGGLDRGALRERIFHDPGAKAWLEALLHPVIRDEIQRQIDTGKSPYAIVVIPLLVESGSYGFLDRVLVVDAPEADQVTRLCQRDGISRELAQRMLATQATRQQRLDKADDVIDNSGQPENLAQQVQGLHETYLKLAPG